MKFITQVLQWGNLNYMDKVITRNEIKLEKYNEEESDLPFFLDFGDSLLEQIKKDSENIFSENKESKILKKFDENKFLEENTEDVSKIFCKISLDIKKINKELYSKLFDSFKKMNSFEIDHFIKKETMFEYTNSLKLINFFSFIFKENNEDFDFKLLIFKVFLQSAAEQLVLNLQDNVGKKIYTTKLEEIKEYIEEEYERSFNEFIEVTTVLELLTNLRNKNFSVI